MNAQYDVNETTEFGNDQDSSSDKALDEIVDKIHNGIPCPVCGTPLFLTADATLSIVDGTEFEDIESS